MKLLRKKNGQWFTVSVAVGGLLLGATSMEVSASEAVVDSQEVSDERDSDDPLEVTGDQSVGSESVDEVVEELTEETKETLLEVAPLVEEQPYIVSEEDEAVGSDVKDESNVTDDSLIKEQVTDNLITKESPSEDVGSEESEMLNENIDLTDDLDGSVDELNVENDSVVEDEEVVVNDGLPLNEELEEAVSELPDDSSSDTHRNEIVNLERTWSEGYRGEGQVVAIIDSGLYINHRAFQNISDLDRARYRSEEELNRAKEAAGIDYGRWFNEKIIFGHNYNDVNDELVELDYASHGTHVSDSAVGNPGEPLDIGTEDDPNAKMYVHGVAPEAQLMFMRVFSDENSPGSTSEYLYVQAIEDAVALGAQSINLSLGAPGGSQYRTTGVLEQAIAFARRQGVSVVIAAGNEDSFGSGHNKPLVENPDYGVVGTPSTSRDSISVAAVDSIKLVNEVLNLTDSEGNVLNLRINIVGNGGQETLESSEYADNEFEYEFVGFGTPEEISEVDLNGKFALISRGDITFAEKAQNALNAGAVGAVIFNNVDDGTLVNMGVDGLVGYPIIGVNYESGQTLIANQETHTLSFTGETLQFNNVNAGNLTDFSSWGLTADGELKPDLAAPGGNVYGAVNNDDYQSMGGTSMASPHVAGAVALLNQKLPEMFEGLEGEELSSLVKALLMSSARPHYNEEQGAFTSPRQQGAGLIDVDNALNSGIYLTGADNYPSISLRNVGDRFEFDINVYNISNETKVLDITTHLTTDAVENSLLGSVFALKPRHLKDVPEGQLIIEANSHQTVTISVDTREFTSQLLADMPNGYFLEGFVSFGTENEGLLSSIPFVGFRGDFSNLDVVEQPVYDYGFNFEEDLSDAPFYYVDLTTGAITTNYTSLISIEDESIITLGEDTVRDFSTDEDVVLAISPDNDGTKDLVAFRGVFLRNYEDFSASVSFVNELGEEELVWISEDVSSGIKNHFSSNPMRPKSTIELSSIWLGQDMNDNIVPEGLYRYNLSFRSQVPGSLSQLMSFNVYVSTTKPEATGADYDEESGVLTLRDVVDSYPGLNPYRTRVSYGQAPDPMLVAFGLAEDTREYFYLNGRDSYSFDIPDYVDLYSPNTRLYLEDFAGNSSEVLLADLLHGESGVVEFKLTDASTGEDLSGAGLRVRIRDEEGTIVAGERLDGNNNQNVRRLPFGTYTAELFLINEEYLEVVDGRVQTFVVSEENSWQTVEFLVNYIERVDFRIDLNQELPDGGLIYLVDSEGVETIVPATSYVNTVHQVRVRAGEYTLRVDLPEGYISEQDGLVVFIDSANRSLSVTIERVEVDKSDLAALIELAEQIDRDSIDAGNILVLDIVLANAKNVFNNEQALQSEVDAASSALRTQLENINLLDPLADEKLVAKQRVTELDLLTQEEISSYHNQIDRAETVEVIDQVVTEAETRQLQLEEELLAKQALETAKSNAVAVVESLPYLSDEEKATFLERIGNALTIEQVDVIIEEANLANEAAFESAEEERLEELIKDRVLLTAKDVAVSAINRLSTLSQEDKDNFVTLVQEAETVDTVKAIMNEAILANDEALKQAKKAARLAEEQARQEAEAAAEREAALQAKLEAAVEAARLAVEQARQEAEAAAEREAALQAELEAAEEAAHALELQAAKDVAENVISQLPSLTEAELESLQSELTVATNVDDVNAVMSKAVLLSGKVSDDVEPVEGTKDDSNENTNESTTGGLIETGDINKVDESELVHEKETLTNYEYLAAKLVTTNDDMKDYEDPQRKVSKVLTSSESDSQVSLVESKGEILPDTATSTWVLGLIGLSSLATGIGVKRKKDD